MLSPTASNAPARKDMHLAARNVPGRVGGGEDGAGRIGRGRVAHTWRVLSMTSDHHAVGPGPVDATRRR